MKAVVLLPQATWCCPACGAPIFPLLQDQETPNEAQALGYSREQIRLCYICSTAHVLDLPGNHKP